MVVFELVVVGFAEGGELRECNTNFYLSLRWNLNILNFQPTFPPPPCEKFFLFLFSRFFGFFSSFIGLKFLDYRPKKSKKNIEEHIVIHLIL